MRVSLAECRILLMFMLPRSPRPLRALSPRLPVESLGSLSPEDGVLLGLAPSPGATLSVKAWWMMLGAEWGLGSAPPMSSCNDNARQILVTLYCM